MDLPATDPHLPPRLDPALCTVSQKLLELAAAPWTFDTMRACWGVTTGVADQYEAALVEHGVILHLPDGRYSMAEAMRERLLIALMNAGELDHARSILWRWRSAAAASGNLLLMATSHEHLANVQMLCGHEEAAIAEDQCALALRQSAGDLGGVARLSWSIGAYYARRGLHKRALPLLMRAVTLAEKLGFEQAPRYRARLLEVQAACD